MHVIAHRWISKLVRPLKAIYLAIAIKRNHGATHVWYCGFEIRKKGDW